MSTRASWEGVHGGWPMVIVQQLRRQPPPGYVSEPRVHLGAQAEIDFAAFENDEALTNYSPDAGGGTATALWAPAAPSVAVETELANDDAYEVRIYDAERGWRPSRS